MLSFAAVSIADPGDCAHSYLLLHDGPDAAAPAAGPYCGAVSKRCRPRGGRQAEGGARAFRKLRTALSGRARATWWPWAPMPTLVPGLAQRDPDVRLLRRFQGGGRAGSPLASTARKRSARPSRDRALLSISRGQTGTTDSVDTWLHFISTSC